ncbi:MAG: bifunctional pyr operon transcriptional regulator/uracil phosphoribosyltransferase PyrR [Nitrospinaceae bacterium]|nr:bifunctional pyr operon transcriptional regulator/uracil phosphoribosyltransferase PyrR [Nitrospinaceae bacterium]MBT3433712.1 bifunctional pyr operon transcriptional regulator/uracil phosphoribosyltransferase PyrR [Nitrospinaceae bacterium]MBT3823165.1 bifunctional pyr operon transcriptional regulator/uracil phosphoribosyltransferase PyrR [Nitrospinaceae bacterium]MBT4093434.1 bifunctional pyr operon transcriptional regulator/uracil phosphoribosyltransferase PyrR [Nitrospinaceae bacterium]M
MKERDLELALRRMASEIIEKCAGDPHLAVIGILTRGEPLARRLAAMLSEMEQIAPPVGTLDIGVHRDDVNNLGDQKILGPTDIPFDLGERQIILVDDVFYTGRTVRAALDALTELGRPRRVWLAVLIDRGHRELPFRPDFVGKNVPTASAERVNVRLREVDGEDGVWLVESD